ncbi:CoA transferase [Parahaliea mediterranea]|uniref:CoA transferase n=1 Tax=Parahaliea mediterranea TaxID=651086 RepID=A0A939IMD5_9GAMM|nr:CoA transferase [Parahaliea mediterranea]
MTKKLTVINLASVGPGARAAQILADLRYSVIQVGVPTSRGALQIEPEAYAYGASRFVRHLRIDLKSISGRRAFHLLIEKADVLIESFRPGVMKKLELDYESLCKVNSSLVYCSVSGYGQQGRYSQWAGHDINYLAVSGFLDCSGRDINGVPAIPGATVADSAGGGMQAVIGIQSALLNRQVTGDGKYLDVSVLDGMLSMMSLHIDKYLATGEQVSAGNDLLTGKYAWYSCYRTADEKFVSIGAIESKFYRNLCVELGLPEYTEQQFDLSVQEELRGKLAKVIASETRLHWVKVLCSRDTCVAPVLGIDEVVSDPHLLERGTFNHVSVGPEARFKQLGPMIAGSEPIEEVEVERGRSQAREILREVGAGSVEIDAWIEEGTLQ